MSCGVSYRCLTIDMQRMFCQRSTLRVGNSCYIPGVMGHPKNARGCHCVLSLCHLMYCHLPNISLWRLRKFTKSQSHLITTAPATALCTWRIQNHQTTCHRVCSFTHSASDHPSTPPPVVPTGRFQGPWPSLLAASTAAPAARSCSITAVWPHFAASCSGVRPQAPKGSETSTAGGSTPWLSTAHPHTRLGEARICGVKSVNFIFSKLCGKLAQWQPLSLLVFVKITKTTNWWHLPEKDIRKGENRFTPNKLNLSQRISSILRLSFTPIQ